MQDLKQNKELYVLEYSPSSKCFHYNTFESMMKSNYGNAASGIVLDYVPVYATYDYERMRAVYNNLSKVLEDKGKDFLRC